MSAGGTTNPGLPARLRTRARIYRDRASWLAARPGEDRTRIGASEVACVLGCGFRTPFEFWRLRTEEGVDEDEPAVADAEDAEHAYDHPLERGNRWEPVAIREYAAAYPGLTVLPAGDAFGEPGALVTVQHAAIDWATASPDALVYDGAEWGGGEAKTSASSPWLWGPTGTVVQGFTGWDDSLFRLGYLYQAMWQCEVLGLPWVDLFVLFGFRLRCYRIERNEEHQRRVVDAVGEWRERHLVRGEAPPVDGSADARGWLSRRYAADKARTIEVAPDTDLGRLVDNFLDAKSRAKRGESDAEILGNKLRAEMTTAYRVVVTGSPTRGVTLTAGASRRLLTW